MKNTFIGLLIAFGILMPALNMAAEMKQSPDARLEVDARRNLGQLSENYRPGVFALTFARHRDYPYDKYVKDIKGGDFRNSGGFSYVDKDPRLLFHKLEWMADHFEKIQRNGGNPHFEISEMPQWLSSCPNFVAPPPAQASINYATCPPRDYNQWAKLVEMTVDYFKNKRGLNLTYTVWSGESDGVNWSDDEESFFKLYQYSVLGVRRVDPNAKIGVGFLVWDGPHQYYPKEGGGLVKSTKGPMLRNLVRYASQTPLPELGLAKLPINFIEHHLFDVSPHVGYWRSAAKGIRARLAEFGYDQNMELFFEFTAPESGNSASSAGSAYLASSLIDMGRIEGRIWPMYNAMFGASYSAYWNVGLFSAHFNPQPQYSKRDYIIRPVYNVFRMFNMLRSGGGGISKKIGTSLSGDLLSAVATESNDKKINVLISNFIPVGASLRSHLQTLAKNLPTLDSIKKELKTIRSKCGLDLVPEKDQRGECRKNYIANLSDPILKERLRTVGRVAACQKQAEKLKCLENVRTTTRDPQSGTDIETLILEIKKVATYVKAPRTVTINIKGVPFSGKAMLTTYIIDNDHANMCSYNTRTGISDSESACGKTGAIDKMVEEAKQEAQRVASEAPSEERLKALEALYFYGRYTTSSGKILATNIWIDKINEDPNISLEGSKKTATVDIVNGALSISISMQPQSVHYLSLKRQ